MMRPMMVPRTMPTISTGLEDREKLSRFSVLEMLMLIEGGIGVEVGSTSSDRAEELGMGFSAVALAAVAALTRLLDSMLDSSIDISLEMNSMSIVETWGVVVVAGETDPSAARREENSSRPKV